MAGVSLAQTHRTSHYAFRQAVKWAMEKEKLGKPQDWKPQYLIDHDSRMNDYFDPNDKSARYARRKYFAGPMALKQPQPNSPARLNLIRHAMTEIGL